MFRNILLSKTRIILLVCLLTITNYSIFANNFIEIKGIISDTKSKFIPYIFVSVENTDVKVVSDISGIFVLQLPDDTKFPFKLTFTSVNYVSQEITITKLNYKELQKVKLIAKEGYLAYEKKRKETEEKIKKESEEKKYEDIITAAGDKDAGFTSAEEVFTTMDMVDAAKVSSESPTIVESKSSPKTLAVKELPSDMRRIPPPPAAPTPNVSAGLLTAGELNDFTKWELWKDIKNTDLNSHKDIWKMYPNERYVAQLTNPNGNAILNAKVTLKDSQGNNIWQTYTDNTGKAELWANILTDSTQNTGSPYYIEFEYQNQTKTIKAEPFHTKINTLDMNIVCNEINAVDIDFIIDATGSMGDEIRYLQEELYDVIQKFQTNNSHIDLQTGSIFYRDFGDEYIIRKSEFSKDITQTVDFIKKQSAAGGGDYPEAADIALYESIENRNWRENTLSKIIFLVLDAPPHALDSCIEQMHRQIKIAAMKGIRIVPLVCSGTDKSTEYLMRTIALATNGTYVFLTDESGIGDPHIKPTTDKYEVEKLNHILLRIITQFSTPPNCNNDWNNFDSAITSFDRFIPKPYKENPEEDTKRIEDVSELLKVYPIPCNSILNIETLLNAPHLYVSDITGKVLQNFELEGTKSFAIDLTGYSNGIYFVNAFYQGRWYCVKFLLNR